ncbi:MAG: DUF475 domain-containing protein [Patescibacteria group bacterium]|jgi:hypothetical protein
MEILNIILVIGGLCLFETISSIDNAIINAEVLTTMGQRARKWFMSWGLIFAVFGVRGLLPWIIVWAVNPYLGPIGALTATFSSDPQIKLAIELSSPMLLAGGGIFLVFLFFHWLFLEEKNFGLPRAEQFFMQNGVWFYALISIILTVVVSMTVKEDPMLALGAVVGSTAFFITHGFKQNAERSEASLMSRNNGLSDISKILYLEIIDATFSVDGVLGAFAFTLAVPLILLGNGVGALVVRQLTLNNIDKIKKYIYLKNGAMYSILILGAIMLFDGLGAEIPQWLSPVSTFAIVGYFFYRSKKAIPAMTPPPVMTQAI